jgi:hypothetical protein
MSHVKSIPKRNIGSLFAINLEGILNSKWIIVYNKVAEKNPTSLVKWMWSSTKYIKLPFLNKLQIILLSYIL